MNCRFTKELTGKQNLALANEYSKFELFVSLYQIMKLILYYRIITCLFIIPKLNQDLQILNSFQSKIAFLNSLDLIPYLLKEDSSYFQFKISDCFIGYNLGLKFRPLAKVHGDSRFSVNCN